MPESIAQDPSNVHPSGFSFEPEIVTFALLASFSAQVAAIPLASSCLRFDNVFQYTDSSVNGFNAFGGVGQLVRTHTPNDDGSNLGARTTRPDDGSNYEALKQYRRPTHSLFQFIAS